MKRLIAYTNHGMGGALTIFKESARFGIIYDQGDHGIEMLDEISHQYHSLFMIRHTIFKTGSTLVVHNYEDFGLFMQKLQIAMSGSRHLDKFNEYCGNTLDYVFRDSMNAYSSSNMTLVMRSETNRYNVLYLKSRKDGSDKFYLQDLKDNDLVPIETGKEYDQVADEFTDSKIIREDLWQILHDK